MAVIQEHIDAGISLCDAVNFIVEKYDLVRTDRRGFNAETQSPLLSSIDILRARKATGLMTRNDYRTVTDITTGKYRGGIDEVIPDGRSRRHQRSGPECGPNRCGY